MITCTNCGTDVTGKKFCPNCGTPVHAVAQAANAPAMTTCPRCGGEVASSAAFCMHCGTALKAQTGQNQPVQQPQSAQPVQMPQQPAYQTYQQYPDPSNQQGQYSQQSYPQPQYPQYPQQQYDPSQYQQYQQPQYDPSQYQQQYSQYNQSGYQQPQYPQSQYPQQQYNQQYGQQYGQPYQQQPYGQYNQGGYSQQPMTLRCPVCMAMAPIGTPNCPSCHTSLAGVVPTPANMPPQGQQGGLGGLFQGNNGKMAMGALGGAAAVLGGEMLLHGIEGNVENRVDGDMGMGFGYDGYERERHHHRREDEGLLGGLGDIANDIGL